MGETGEIRVGLVCEAGGPMKQIQRLERGLTEFDRFYLSYRTEATADREGYLLSKRFQRVAGGLFERELNREKLLALVYVPVLFASVFYVLARERPDVVLSTGDLTIAGPSFCVARLLGIRTVFVDDVGAFEGASTCGRVLAPLADRVVVQHPEALDDHAPDAEYHGGVL